MTEAQLDLLLCVAKDLQNMYHMVNDARFYNSTVNSRRGALIEKVLQERELALEDYVKGT